MSKKIIPVIFAAVIVFISLNASLAQAAPQPGGNFGAHSRRGPEFPTAASFTEKFDSTLFWSRSYKLPSFSSPDKDYRNLNPDGIYMKHVNMIVTSPLFACKDVGTYCKLKSAPYEMPDYEYISTYHPEWFVRDDAGNRIQGPSTEHYILDFANDEYLDWLFNHWFPEDFLEPNDKYFMHDNGFLRMSRVYSYVNYVSHSTCTNPVCAKYYSNADWQNAYIKYLKKFKEKYEGKYYIILNVFFPENENGNEGFKNVLQYTDGAFFEFLALDSSFQGNYSASQKRVNDKAHISFSSWFRDNNKFYMPRAGGGWSAYISIGYSGSGADPILTVSNNLFTIATGVPGEDFSVNLLDERYNTIKELADFLKTKPYLSVLSVLTPYDYVASSNLSNQSKKIFKNPINASDQTFILGPPPQESVDYNWALFNLARHENGKFFFTLTTVEKDGGQVWAKTYPEMFKSLGASKEDAVEFRPNVYRREFEGAIAYVNDSDTSQQIDLPAGFSYVNSRDQAVNSPITLRTFSGLTVYKSSPQYKNADLNQDTQINQTDLDILKTDFLKLTASLANPRSDINSDGQCTARDLGILMSGWGK